MMSAKLPHDPKWTRANTLLASRNPNTKIAMVGVPANKGSISPTSADQTPDAIRSALARFSTYSTSQDIELTEELFADLGNIDSPDGLEGVFRVHAFVKDLLSRHELIIALGGDNSITYSVASGLWPDLSKIFSDKLSMRAGGCVSKRSRWLSSQMVPPSSPSTVSQRRAK